MNSINKRLLVLPVVAMFGLAFVAGCEDSVEENLEEAQENMQEAQENQAEGDYEEAAEDRQDAMEDYGDAQQQAAENAAEGDNPMTGD